jgi:hypothetical protein
MFRFQNWILGQNEVPEKINKKIHIYVNLVNTLYHRYTVYINSIQYPPSHKVILTSHQDIIF